MKRLAIVTTHPIQYYAPVFRMLTERVNIQIKVFYTWGEGAMNKYDPGFGKQVSWDIPLLDGYDYALVHNSSKQPGSHHRGGIVNPGLIRDIASWGADAVLVFGWNYHSHFRVMRHFKGRIPVLFRGDSTLLDERSGFKKYLRRLVLRYVYRFVDKALYVGTENKRYFLAHGLKEEQLVFAPHAVDNERFADPLQDDKGKAWRKKLGYADDDHVILFAGKFEPKKDPELLLRAVQANNITAQKPWRLFMVGNGVLEKRLKAMAQDDPNIQFLPFQNQQVMPALYRVCDVFCLPSKGPGETWGLAVNEAMAGGRPVLVSDRCGCAVDLVQPGINGWRFAAGDALALQDILREAATSDLKHMGQKAREDVTNWSFDAQCSALESSLTQPVTVES